MIVIVALCLLAISTDIAAGQGANGRSPTDVGGLDERLETISLVQAQNRFEESESVLADQMRVEATSHKFRVRQALLLSGVAVSMLAYGYFALRFNSTRNDAESARLAYEADVSENAQRYVDEGVLLDQIPTYYAWQRSYTDAANARELIAVAGVSAFLLGIGAILDSATYVPKQPSQLQARFVTPVVGVSPSSGDVMLGARIGL